jgi:hypothetical protein
MPSNEKQKHEEQKYYERLNISVLSITKIKNLIKKNIVDTLNAWEHKRNVKKQCFRIIGPAGVGKTDICRQMVEELSSETSHNFSMIMVKAPVLSRDDFIIPFPVTKDGNATFKMLYSDFVPVEKDSYGIFVVDEFSRGDHALQQLLWQAMDEYAIHLHEFPKGWFVIAVDNPDDSEYQMDMMEDAAGLRRQLHLYSEVSAKDFLQYAIQQGYHKLIIEFIQTHPDYLYDFESQKHGSVYANPASYEKLSDHLIKFDMNGGVANNYESVEIIASGLLNTNMAKMFISFARDQRDINPKDIFYDYASVKKAIETFVKDGDNSMLSQIMVSFCTFMTSSMPEFDKTHLDNIESFLLLMPIDTSALFISQVDSFDRSSVEFKYMTKIHISLMKVSKKYRKNFYEPVVAVGRSS